MRLIYKLREKLTPRTAVVYAAVVLMCYTARPSSWGWVVVGTVMMIAGEALRVWGCGHLVKTREFTVSGPYARIRHPLYLGSYLIACGFAVGGEIWWMLFLWQAAFALYYYPRKEVTELKRLIDAHGECVWEYALGVPALVPGVRRYRGGDTGHSWSFGRVTSNSEWGITVLVVLSAVWLWVRFSGVV